MPQINTCGSLYSLLDTGEKRMCNEWIPRWPIVLFMSCDPTLTPSGKVPKWGGKIMTRFPIKINLSLRCCSADIHLRLYV